MTRLLEKPPGDPRKWTPGQWLEYNAWEAAQPEPPRLGPWESLEQYYTAEEWLEIVRQSLESHQVNLGVARRGGNAEAVEFFKRQIEACEVELRLGEIKQATLFQ